MSLLTHIGDEATGDHVRIYDWLALDVRPSTTSLSVLHPAAALGQFRASSRTTAGVSPVVTPPKEGSIIVTDLIVNGDRTNGGTVTVRFNDGIRSIDIFSADVTDAPVNVALQFGGRVRGWRDARLELVTVQAVFANVTTVYVKSPMSLEFDVWDEQR